MAVIDAVIESRAQAAVEVLVRLEKVSAAYLFGSHIDGTADANSDIDLAVFVEGVENWDLIRRAKTSARVHKEVGSDIELHYFPAETLTNAEPASFAAYVLCHSVPIPIEKE